MPVNLNQLTAISPIDGRYFGQTKTLSEYFSESGLIKTRAEIELKYLILLSQLKICRKISRKEKNLINNIYKNFSIADAEKVKEFEETTHHDVKALEYYLREALEKSSLADLLNLLHFGLTSYDINDNAYRLMVKRALTKILIPNIKQVIDNLNEIGKKNIKLPILGRTHGQGAVPTTFGKEIAVFSVRLQKQLSILRKIKLYGKFGGSVGNWNSLALSFPKQNWITISTKFLKNLGLEHSTITTQIAPSEDIVEVFQTIQRINSILLDLDQDIWRYISDGWLVQKGKTKFVGSSTMPQKVNPIEFENSEGNLVMANGIFETFSRKLPISRLQRDLSDSTVLRNIGVAFAHSLVAYSSCLKGLETIEPNKEKVLKDLNEDWSILSEALQTILRKEGKSDAYEKVASLVRGKKIDQKVWKKMINSTELNKNDKKRLLKLTPSNYLGYSNKL